MRVFCTNLTLVISVQFNLQNDVVIHLGNEIFVGLEMAVIHKKNTCMNHIDIGSLRTMIG